MSLDSDMTSFLLGVMPPAPPNTTDVLSGLAGTGSVVDTGFDAVTGGGGGGGGTFDGFSTPVDSGMEANFSTIATSTLSTMDPFMASTYDKLKCGHFTLVEKKLHFTIDVAETCRFWSEGVLSLSLIHI